MRGLNILVGFDGGYTWDVTVYQTLLFLEYFQKPQVYHHNLPQNTRNSIPIEPNSKLQMLQELFVNMKSCL